MSPVTGLRLLPWLGQDGKPCYLSTADGDSFMSRLADGMEAMQIGMSADLLEGVQEMMATAATSETELRNLIGCLCQALRDTLRVAESRGGRLPQPDADAASRAVRTVIDREFTR